MFSHYKSWNEPHTHIHLHKICQSNLESTPSAKMWNSNVNACRFCHWILDSLMPTISIHYCITIVWSNIDVNRTKVIKYIKLEFVVTWGVEIESEKRKQYENEMRNVKLIKSFSGLDPFQLTKQFHSTQFF